MVKPHVRTRNRPQPAEPAIRSSKLRDNLRIVTTYVPIGTLNPPTRVLRKHGKRGLAAIKASIAEFGIIKPILIDAERRIITGHGVWLAAKEMAIAEMPVIELSHLSPEQLRLYQIADNQIPTLSAWDEEALRLELGELARLELDLELNLELTGFTTSQIDDRLIAADADPGKDADDELPELEEQAVTRPDDIWECGKGRLLCGDSLNEESYQALLGDERAQLVVSDSPFNIKIKGNVSSSRKAREFLMASSEMSDEEFICFLVTVFALLAAHSIDGSIHFQFMDWRHIGEMLAAGRNSYSELKNLLVWNKGSAGLGTFYRSQHELIFVWKSGSAPHINNFGLGETGRWRSNVLDYPGCAGFRKGRAEDLAAHPTVKNTTMIADLIRDCSKRGGIVLDPFGGSGTTLIAAERTGRRARLIELDPLYCDVAVRRWQKACGMAAILAGTGQTFDEVAAERSSFGEEA